MSRTVAVVIVWICSARPKWVHAEICLLACRLQHKPMQQCGKCFSLVLHFCKTGFKNHKTFKGFFTCSPKLEMSGPLNDPFTEGPFQDCPPATSCTCPLNIFQCSILGSELHIDMLCFWVNYRFITKVCSDFHIAKKLLLLVGECQSTVGLQKLWYSKAHVTNAPTVRAFNLNSFKCLFFDFEDDGADFSEEHSTSIPLVFSNKPSALSIFANRPSWSLMKSSVQKEASGSALRAPTASLRPKSIEQHASQDMFVVLAKLYYPI